jgi:Gas vesicle synthesis protein GvpL/GvpF
VSLVLRISGTRVSADVKKGNATYVYCVVAAPKRPRLAGVPAGLPGTGPIRLLDIDAGRHVVVADAPLPQYGEAAIRRGLSNLAWVSRAAVSHEAVVEAFIDATAVLPMKLFTLFTSDERAIAHLRGDRRRIESLVKRLANHHEWGVRLVLDRPAADGRRAAARAKQTRSPGVEYLTQKRAERDAAMERAKHARAIAADLYDRLSARSHAAQRRPASELHVQGGPLLMDAAFLVPRSRSRAFAALLRREQRALVRKGFALTVTGPWPPYTFVQDSD